MISLVHPSRGRPQKSFDNAKEWISKANVDCQLIVSLDDDDISSRDYISLYNELTKPESKHTVIISKNTCVVEAANAAAKEARGEILVYLSDDFKCFDNWGQVVENEFKDSTGPMLIKVDDCLQRLGKDVLTIPIMNRQLYDSLGYFFHPAYKSMFCDQDLYHTVRNMGALKMAEHLKFPHDHYVNGKTPNDETYKRSTANWDQGKNLYMNRRAQNFPR